MANSKENAACPKCTKRTSIGGQALIEGIMMKGPNNTAMAIRRADGSIKIKPVDWGTPNKTIVKIPIVRGVYNMVMSLIVGSKCITESAEVSLEDIANEEAAESALDEATSDEVAATDDSKKDSAESGDEKKGSPIGSAVMNVLMVLATALGVVLAVVLFMYLPSLTFDGINYLAGGNLDFLRTVIEGVLKIAIFLAYLSLITLMKDIRRVFQYHGAEHKTIFCYESGKELTVENVRGFKRFHPRCGTSFMFLMILLSIVFSSILMICTDLEEIRWLWVCVKILLIPFLCGVGYELIKFCGRHDNLLTRIIAAPGLWVQRLTTKEPDDSMIECAIAAIKEVIPENSEEDRW